MRDPRRIKTILANLRALWECEPDLRFWQLIEALKPKEDPFFMEDDEALELLSGGVELPKEIVFVTVLVTGERDVSARVFSTYESAALAAAWAIQRCLADRDVTPWPLREILKDGRREEYSHPLMFSGWTSKLQAHVYARELDSGWL